jgi:hypothetical protein
MAQELNIALVGPYFRLAKYDHLARIIMFPMKRGLFDG